MRAEEAAAAVAVWFSLFAVGSISAFQQWKHPHPQPPQPKRRPQIIPASSSSFLLHMATFGNREDEIRRKIMQLKKQGKIKSPPSLLDNNDDSYYSYQEKIQKKLEKTRDNNDGIVDSLFNEIDDDDDDEPGGGIDSTSKESIQSPRGRQRLGKQTVSNQPVDAAADIQDPSSSPDNNNREEEELSDDELIQKVIERLAEKEAAERLRLRVVTTDAQSSILTTTTDETRSEISTGSGMDGGEKKTEDADDTDLYQPKSGSWGAFPRPKDISKAYGGGRRVGAGFSSEDDDPMAKISTQNRLQEYRRKVGIDVPAEREHASEIQEALEIAQLAMQRGVYDTAVSALEKVTQWCSTNSKVGSKIFLELAMAYEASGRTQQACQIYKTLSTCRMEDVKYNAKRLLYGLEAMEIMRDVSSDFSRQQIKNTFLDATGLRDIARNFDDVYQTAYVDLDNGGFYKKLTESVVRSNKEARQILLQATGKGEVGRTRIVQALRSLARHFDDALELEIKSKQQREQPTVFLNGKPLIASDQAAAADASSASNLDDDFVLASPQLMLDNLDGTWRLQLLADKQGDGVSFFNTTTAIQEISIANMTFVATGPSGLTKIQCSGTLKMDDNDDDSNSNNNRRIIEKTQVRVEGAAGSLLGLLGSNPHSGFLAAVSRPQQQIISVDSMLLITQSPPARTEKDASKEHFAVWRRVPSSPEY